MLAKTHTKKFENILHLLTKQEQMTGQDITEVILQFMLNAVLQFLHLEICLQKARTGVSFPDFFLLMCCEKVSFLYMPGSVATSLKPVLHYDHK